MWPLESRILLGVVRFPNPLAFGSGLGERTPKKVIASTSEAGTLSTQDKARHLNHVGEREIVKFGQTPSVRSGRVWIHSNESLTQNFSRIAIWRCSLNVLKIPLLECSPNVFFIAIAFVFVIVIVFVFVFVVVFLLARSCFLMILISFASLEVGLEGWKALNPTQSQEQ